MIFKKTTLLGAAMLLGFSTFAHAHEYDALIKAKKYAEVEKAANSRLATTPNQADALAAKIELILIEGKDNRLDEAVKLAEQCINANPKFSECFELHGNVFGLKAQKANMMSAMSYANKFKDSIKKAIELDTNNFGARFSLLQFYIQAPSIAGGGTSKARDFIVETIKVSPVAGSLFQAYLDVADDNLARAMSAAMAVNTNGNENLNKIHRSVLSNLGHNLINTKKYSDAEKVFAEALQRYPDSAIGSFGLGKNLQEQGKQKESVPYFEKAIATDASAAAYYRLAKAQQALGEKAKAISNYEKALNFHPEMAKKSKADAEEQIKSLKG